MTAAEPSLRRNFSWTLIGNLVYAGSQWGILMVLTKSLAPAQVGQFALGLAVTAPIILFANLHLRTLQATDARGEFTFGQYLRVRLIATLLALCIIVAIAGLAGYRRETALVIVAIGLAKAVEAVSDVIYGLMQQQEQMDRIAISMMLRGPISLGMLAAVLWWTGDLLWAIIAMAIVWLGVLLLFDLPGCRVVLSDSGATVTVARARHSLSRLLMTAMPMGMVATLVSLVPNIPRYYVERYLGEAELGIFSAMAYLIVAGTTVVGALGQSATSRLARLHAEDDLPAFRHLMLKLASFGAGLGLAGVLVAMIGGESLLRLLYTAEYARHSEVLVWLMAAAGFGYIASFLWYGITAARALGPQLPLFGAVLLVAIVASALGIPSFGLKGAAGALCLAMVVQMLGSLYLLVQVSHRHRRAC